MHELFICANVSHEDYVATLLIIQGYCSMIPEKLIRRRLIFEGPRSRVLQGLDPQTIATRAKHSPPKLMLWKTLHDQLSRQSFKITLIYELSMDDFTQPKVTGADDMPEIPGP